ncbi:MAG: hypothetical protein ACXQT3_05665 [Methermicoccaceae archaeon]
MHVKRAMPSPQRSVVLTQDELALLSRRARELGWTAEQKEAYELLCAKGSDSRLMVYGTGTVVYAGDEAKSLLSDVLAPPSFDAVVGSDEAGKGEWYGPLVVVAIGASPSQLLEMRMLGIRDSKSLARGRLLRLGEALQHLNVPKGVVVLTCKRYNELYARLSREGKGLNDLLAWAHATAIADVLRAFRDVRAVRITVDEFDAPKLAARLRAKGITHTLVQRHGAEDEPEVAAASVLAKHIFDTEVERLEKTYGIKLKGASPASIPDEILPEVAKLHFKNVGR